MNHNIFRLLPMGIALRHALLQGYRLKDFNADFKAAFVVSLIALPLSMALAIAVGLAPIHGITTAIVAGVVASYFGGSLFQISGPTAAFVMILIPIVSEMGLQGLIWCQLLAGIFLVLFGVFKLGKLIHYVPYAVIIGFTSAIALVIASISLKDFFAIPITEASHHFAGKVAFIFSHLDNMQVHNAIVGLVTLLLVIFTKDKIKWLPSPIIGVIAGAILAYVFNFLGHPIMTIGTEFHTLIQGKEIAGLPPLASSFSLPTLPTLDEFYLLVIPALMISALAALESLLSATIADNLTQTKHYPNSELNGIGLANIFSAMAGGIPATAAIARTATNIQNGARSPLAGILHALLVLGYVLLFAPLINLIPMASLAALLLVTAYRMSHAREFWHVLRSHDLFDKMVLLATFMFTLLVDMVMGISMGMMLVVLHYFIKRVRSWAKASAQ
ncbi:MAG: C4-dicarboxylic acid transporter DauA [Proteobacteria bacterium]|nr:C4-dicarboxylic acid transporter DauA [Pseudomonadota bacterium]